MPNKPKPKAKPKKKNLGGRPTKYKGEDTINAIHAIRLAMTAEQFFSYCSVDHLADALDVNPDTIYEWKKRHPKFSEAIKRWETKRNSLFYHLLQHGGIQPGPWIFLAKNWLGMTDRQSIEHSGSERKPLALIIETKPPNGQPNDNGPENNADANGDG